MNQIVSQWRVTQAAKIASWCIKCTLRRRKDLLPVLTAGPEAAALPLQAELLAFKGQPNLNRGLPQPGSHHCFWSLFHITKVTNGKAIETTIKGPNSKKASKWKFIIICKKKKYRFKKKGKQLPSIHNAHFRHKNWVYFIVFFIFVPVYSFHPLLVH